MQVFLAPFRFWEFLQANTPASVVEQSFSNLANPDNLLAFLQTPEFRIFSAIVAIAAVVLIAVHVWAWLQMLTTPEQMTTAFASDKQQLYAPPSQQYVPEGQLWQSSRIGFAPELGFVNHQPKDSEPTRSEPTPARGGDYLP